MVYPLFKLRSSAQRQFARTHLACVRGVAGHRAVPLGYWLAVRRVVGLLSRFGGGLSLPSMPHKATALGIPALEEALSGTTLGEWVLDAETILTLWGSLAKVTPKSILEFGSGTSTVVLASYAARHNPSSRIVSMEQNSWACEATLSLLEGNNLNGVVNIIHAPLSPCDAYTAGTDTLVRLFANVRPDWLLVDGPSGRPGCRVHTLLRYGRFCAPGARWFLDDAFRDGELEVLRRWDATPGIRVEGIYPVGKGLGTGIIVDPEAIPDCDSPADSMGPKVA